MYVTYTLNKNLPITVTWIVGVVWSLLMLLAKWADKMSKPTTVINFDFRYCFGMPRLARYKVQAHLAYWCRYASMWDQLFQQLRSWLRKYVFRAFKELWKEQGHLARESHTVPCSIPFSNPRLPSLLLRKKSITEHSMSFITHDLLLILKPLLRFSTKWDV